MEGRKEGGRKEEINEKQLRGKEVSNIFLKPYVNHGTSTQ
jgi:hypothetical protein